VNYQLWSWLLTFIGLAGFILAGKRVWWAWYINIACQALWYTYAFISHQYGFVFSATVYTIVFTQNAIKWTKERKKESE
jgi:hypothetical protein